MLISQWSNPGVYRDSLSQDGVPLEVLRCAAAAPGSLRPPSAGGELQPGRLQHLGQQPPGRLPAGPRQPRHLRGGGVRGAGRALAVSAGEVPGPQGAPPARGRDHQHQVQAPGQGSGRAECHQLPGGDVSVNTVGLASSGQQP